MAIKYSNVMNTRTTALNTPLTSPIPGKKMVKNNTGAFVFELSPLQALDRFLILGTTSPTYYASEKKLTVDAANNVVKAIEADGLAVVARIVEISESGRAPKNDPALFALALCMSVGDDATKRAAYLAIPKVARIGTHILHLAEYVNGMRGWGRGIRTAFGNWYNSKTALELAKQMTKYANRDGWTHADILRLSHPKPISSTHDALFTDAVGKAKNIEIDADVAAYMSAVGELKATRKVSEAVKLITDFQLPREVVPTELLTEADVWAALAPHMGMTALVRNLATMTKVGFIGQTGEGKKLVLEKFGDADTIKKSRIHPIQVLSALRTYNMGHGIRGNSTWTPVNQIVDALDEMFYIAFGNVKPTGKRVGLFLDISASMGMGDIAGISGLTPRAATAAMAMVIMRTEQDWFIEGFSNNLINLKLSPKMRLDDVENYMRGLPFGCTNVALPWIWGKLSMTEFDAAIVMTDNEVNAGTHPALALKEYRKSVVSDAMQIVVGMTVTNFTVADPNDAGSLDVVGFDAAAPELMSGFIRGDF